MKKIKTLFFFVRNCFTYYDRFYLENNACDKKKYTFFKQKKSWRNFYIEFKPFES